VEDTVYPTDWLQPRRENPLRQLHPHGAYPRSTSRPMAASATAALFHKLTGSEAGVADGAEVRSDGNVYCTGPGGVHVIDPTGKLLAGC